MEPTNPYNNFTPLYDASKPFPPSWARSAEANQILGAIPSVPFLNFPPWLGAQTWIEPKYENPWKLSSDLPVATSPAGLNRANGLSSNKDAALAVSGSEQRLSGGNLEGAPLSVASGNIILSSEGGHEAKNNHDLPSAKMHKMLGNGKDASQKNSGVKNSAVVDQNGSSAATKNPAELTQNLKTGLNASGSDIDPKEKEDEETRRARKRQANNESCKRTRIKKKKQYDELNNTVNNLREGNFNLRSKLRVLSNECSQLTKENDSIMEELKEKYGEEAISNLIKESLPEPPESIAGIEK